MSNAIQEEKRVIIGEKEISVKKLNLRQTARLMEAIRLLPEQFLTEARGQIDNAAFIQQLPELIMEILPKCADLVARTLENQIEGEELLDADVEEVLALIEAFLEVNNIAKVVARLGKVKALATGKGLQEAIG